VPAGFGDGVAVSVDGRLLVGVGDKVGVSVAISVPVAVTDGTGDPVGSGVSVGVADGGGVPVVVGVGAGMLVIVVAADVSAARATADGVAVTLASAVKSESGLMLRTRATPKHSKATRTRPPPMATPMANLRRLRLSIIIPLPLL
jgi:hypothetical protein